MTVRTDGRRPTSLSFPGSSASLSAASCEGMFPSPSAPFLGPAGARTAAGTAYRDTEL